MPITASVAVGRQPHHHDGTLLFVVNGMTLSVPIA